MARRRRRRSFLWLIDKLRRVCLGESECFVVPMVCGVLLECRLVERSLLENVLVRLVPSESVVVVPSWSNVVVSFLPVIKILDWVCRRAPFVLECIVLLWKVRCRVGSVGSVRGIADDVPYYLNLSGSCLLLVLPLDVLVVLLLCRKVDRSQSVGGVVLVEMFVDRLSKSILNLGDCCHKRFKIWRLVECEESKEKSKGESAMYEKLFYDLRESNRDEGETYLLGYIIRRETGYIGWSSCY